MTIQKLFVALSSVLCFSSVFAYDGTITINGKVTDQTCSVLTGTADQTVTLPDVGVSALNTSGQGSKTAGMTPFTIQLQDCQIAADSQVTAYFEPDAGITNDLLVNNATSPAGNVRVQLLNGQYQPIKLSSGTAAAQESTRVSVDNASPVLNYFAQYYADGQVTPGNVRAQVRYTIVYN